MSAVAALRRKRLRKTKAQLVDELEQLEQDRRQGQFPETVAALQEGFALYDKDDRLVLFNEEYQTVVFVVDGEPNKRIAHNLGLSEKTIEFHRSNIMKKLKAKSLAELVRKTMAGNST